MFMNWWKRKRTVDTTPESTPEPGKTIVLKGTPVEVAKQFLATFAHVTIIGAERCGLPTYDNFRKVIQSLIDDCEQQHLYVRELRAEQRVIREAIKRVANEKAEIEKQYTALRAEMDDARDLCGTGPNVLVSRRLIYDMIRRGQAEGSVSSETS